MAQIAGAIIVSMVVSKVVSEIGPKLGFSESTSNMLGMAAGMYAGGTVGGGSTTASTQTAGATTSQVGADIPSGYGGNIPGTPLATGGAPPGGTPGAGSAAISQGAQMGAQGVPSLQAPVEGVVASPVESQLLDPGTPLDAATAGKPPAEKPGMLSQDMGASAFEGQATSQAGQMAGGSTAKDVIQSELTGARDQTSVQKKDAGTDWWGRLFSPEKTMDLAMAGIGGYGTAAQEKYKIDRPEEIAKQNEQQWQTAHPGMLSLGRDYPSTR